GVAAFARVFRNDVHQAVDHVGVITQAARHGVGTESAVKYVVAIVAGERVIERIAGGVDVPGAGEGQVLQVRPEGEAYRGLHAVDAARHPGQGLDHLVEHVVHDIGVVARAPAHRVGASATVEQVVAGIAGERVVERIAGGVDVGRAGEYKVLDVVRQAIAHRGLHGVGAAGGILGRDIARIVHHVDVVAGSADHFVGPDTAIEPVRCGVAGEDVVAVVAGGVDRAAAQQGDVFQFLTQGNGIGEGAFHRIDA